VVRNIVKDLKMNEVIHEKWGSFSSTLHKREMLRIVYFMLKRMEPYRGEDSRLRRRKLIRLRRRAS